MSDCDEKYEKELIEYRNHVNGLLKEAQHGYDRTLLLLSSGAFVVTFTFISNFFEPKTIKSTEWLLWTWKCWGMSLLCILASHYFSVKTMQRILSKIGTDLNSDGWTGWHDRITRFLNPLGGLLFFVGLFLVMKFIEKNIGGM